jgi:hypothetical protein
MILKAEIKNGKLVEKLPYIFELEGLVEIEIRKPRRTSKQNASLHKYFSLVAKALREEGIDFKALLSEEIDHPVTEEAIKYLWKRLEYAMYNKEKTSELKTDEVSKVYDVFNKIIGERGGVHVPFPSKE